MDGEYEVEQIQTLSVRVTGVPGTLEGSWIEEDEWSSQGVKTQRWLVSDFITEPWAHNIVTITCQPPISLHIKLHQKPNMVPWTGHRLSHVGMPCLWGGGVNVRVVPFNALPSDLNVLSKLSLHHLTDPPSKLILSADPSVNPHQLLSLVHLQLKEICHEAI